MSGERSLVPSTAQLIDAPPPVLMPYQQRWIADPSPFKLMEKGRRTGITWAEASDNVLIAAADKAAGGQNVYYIGTDKEMTEEYIDACAMWCRVFNQAASEIAEGIWEEDADGDKNANISTFTIRFPHSGHKIVALASRPRKLRGRQGVLVGDEGAFQDSLKELIDAAMAFLIWGGKVRIVSTHFGADNAFNELVQDVRSGNRRGSVHRVTFQEAVADGLYQRVCIRTRKPYSAAAEAEWVKGIYAYYAEGSAEELDCIPSKSSGVYLTSALIESRMSESTPLVRGRWPDEFALLPEPERRAHIEQWCEQELAPVLSLLDSGNSHYMGQDFGRVSDLTSINIGEEGSDLNIRVKLAVELSNCPFTQQEQILWYILDRVPRFRSGAMDASGNGASLAEKTADKYGHQRIDQVKLSESFYLLNFPPFKKAFEDGSFRDLPQDSQVRDDYRAIRTVRGVPKLPSVKTQKGDGQKLTRHGDSAISGLMLHYASRREVVDISGVRTSGRMRESYAIADFMGDT